MSSSDRQRVWVTNRIDGTMQPCYVTLPAGYGARTPVPLLVSLHSWSGDVEQRHPALERGADERGWIYLFPNFRGPNRCPEACGSTAAQQAVIDAVEWALEGYPIDRERVYLTGSSGGGHMAMLLAGRYPERFTAVSAWVGISDLAAWHQIHANDHYGQMLRQCCGGAPGDGAAVDRQYRLRSPATWLSAAVPVPLDLAAGVHDGHTGSVPVRHSLAAFNIVAAAQGEATIAEADIAAISRPQGRLEKPQSSDNVVDSAFGRPIYLRRTAGKARVTIFEGGHERLDEAALEWLSRHRRATSAARRPGEQHRAPRRSS